MVATTIDDPVRACAPVTGRERDVLSALGRGLTNSEIAAALATSETAVDGDVGQLLTRLGLRDRAAAIVYAFDHGIVTPRQIPAPGARLRISVLGPVQVSSGAEPVAVGPVRQQALLAALVLRPDVTVSRRELLDRVWGLEPPAGNVVPVYVYRLRKCLPPGDLITRDGAGYRFAGRGIRLDSSRLEELVAEANAARHAGDLSAAVAGYGRALELFRGEPLAGLPGPFAELERLRLTERRMVLSQQKAEWQLRLGRHADAVGELWTLVPEHPHSEPLAALLMRALHRAGRPADALAVFARTRRRLADDLGVQPGEVLRGARRAVLQGV
jgi:DNA-binding SARP family transcriptional activator/DNA-binding CsgD family transcriptional regulator